MRLGECLLNAFERHPLFMSAALPARMVPPLFNRYGVGETYGRHIDGAVRPIARQAYRVRTDLSATLFLSEPHEYDGGELVIERAAGAPHSYKLPAGTLLLYPAHSVHEVRPVGRGERFAAFFWVQSLVRHHDRRELLLALDRTIQQLRARHPQDDSLVELTGHYHNLLRLWAEL